jgi:hypothetical protein
VRTDGQALRGRNEIETEEEERVGLGKWGKGTFVDRWVKVRVVSKE